MNKDQREIQRKLGLLRYADEIGHVAKTCRNFGIGRSSFYRWRQAYAELGEVGLINAPPILNGTPTEHRPSARRRVSIFAANTTSAQCGSFGFLSAITTSRYQTRQFHGFSAAMK